MAARAEHGIDLARGLGGMELKTPIRQHLHLQALAGLNAEVRRQLLTQSHLALTDRRERCGHRAEGNGKLERKAIFPCSPNRSSRKRLSSILHSLYRIEECQEKQAGPRRPCDPKSPLESEGRLKSVVYPAAPWG